MLFPLIYKNIGPEIAGTYIHYFRRIFPPIDPAFGPLYRMLMESRMLLEAITSSNTYQLGEIRWSLGAL